ncbi:MAG: hypothetical protein CSB48_01230 [Proteobacteria bacterium]|nr:MAG: hypothetical protein CSB48_01230 [Pseudomonadota bacterium]
MTKENNQPTRQCATGEKVATQFIDWSAKYPEIVGQDASAIQNKFNRYARQFEQMQRAAGRPMGVAVFGPSQAGKSYLISALARKETEPLVACFGERRVDFIREINPGGGKESTGIVTRFTTSKSAVPYPDAPVTVRLLSELDIVKIIANSYFSDVQASSITPLTGDEIAAVIQEAIAAKQAAQATEIASNPLTSRDVYDLRSYLSRYFRGISRLECIDDSVWNRFVTLIPDLPLPARARLLSLFWGEHDAFTRLYIRLGNALNQLDHSPVAYCGLESVPGSQMTGALLPRENSVIDVATIRQLGEDESENIHVRSAQGQAITLRRCDFAALIAELVIQMEDRPYDYFDYTDLLDFPGYRAREEIEDVDTFLVRKNGLPRFFLRGKVDFLYRRYREDRELTSMILCVAASNQDVNSLPEAVFEWIADTHGDSPEERINKPVTLFLALTMFDKEFEEKQGMGEKDEDYVNQWETRLHASVWEFLGKQHDWVEHWTPDAPFNKVFWIRNPNYMAKHIFSYDDQGKEIGIVESPRERARIDKLRNGFLNNPRVTRHFEHPERAFDEALMPNSGGVSYLAHQLGKICTPELKTTQLGNQIQRLYSEMRTQMEQYYVGDDQAEMVRKRQESARETLHNLLRCIEAQRFGNFLGELHMPEDEISRIYYRLHREGPTDSTQEDDSDTPATISLSILDGILESDTSGSGSTHSSGDPDSSRFARALAAEVVSTWISRLNELAEDTAALSWYRITGATVQDIIKELGSGSSRVRLEERIARIVSQTESKRLTIHDAVKLPSRQAAQIISRFINYLGFKATALADRPRVAGRPVFSPVTKTGGLPQLEEAPQHYERQYTRDWLKAYLEFVTLNATFDPTGNAGGDSFFNPHANEALNRLLGEIRP